LYKVYLLIRTNLFIYLTLEIKVGCNNVKSWLWKSDAISTQNAWSISYFITFLFTLFLNSWRMSQNHKIYLKLFFYHSQTCISRKPAPQR